MSEEISSLSHAMQQTTKALIDCQKSMNKTQDINRESLNAEQTENLLKLMETLVDTKLQLVKEIEADRFSYIEEKIVREMEAALDQAISKPMDAKINQVYLSIFGYNSAMWQVLRDMQKLLKTMDFIKEKRGKRVEKIDRDESNVSKRRRQWNFVENEEGGDPMKLESTSFLHGQTIPQRFTCQGEDISPELIIHAVPPQTQSLVLIMDDPDAPSGVFDHWVAWNIPADTKKIAEGAVLKQLGKNSYGQKGYRGPCPPPGKAHRYYFKIYALDTMLSLPDGINKKKVENAFEGHVLGMAELMGTYQRQE